MVDIVNAFPNPSAEAGGSGFAASHTTAVLGDTTWSVVGTGAVKVTGDSSPTTSVYAYPLPAVNTDPATNGHSRFAAVPGDTFDLLMTVRADPGNPAPITIHPVMVGYYWNGTAEKNSTGVPTTTWPDLQLDPGEVGEIVGRITVPTATDPIDGILVLPYIRGVPFNTAPPAGTVVYYDRLMLVRNAPQLLTTDDYFDGDSPGASWSGDANKSSSTGPYLERHSGDLAATPLGLSAALTAAPSGALGAEDFEGQPAGTTITVLNTSFANVTGAAAMTYAADQAHAGTRSGRILCANNFGIWRTDLAAPIPKLYLRRYYRVDAAITSGAALRMIALLDGSTISVMVVGSVSAAHGKLQLTNGTTTVATSTMDMPVAEWFRLELGVDLDANTAELRIFAGANVDGATPDEVLTGTADTTATVDTIRDGQQLARTSTLWIDDMAANASGWIGSGQVGGDLEDEPLGLSADLDGRKQVVAALTGGQLGLAAPEFTGEKESAADLVAPPLGLSSRLTAGTGSLRLSWVQLAADSAGPAQLRTSWMQLDAPAGPAIPPKLRASWIELETGAVQAHVKTRKSGAWVQSPVKVRRVGAWR